VSFDKLQSEHRKHPGVLSLSSAYLAACPQPLLRPVLYTVRSRASSFNFQYPLISLRSSSSCLRLLPRLLITSTLPFIFPSVMCFRRQFIRRI
jgi:hypothetical protein